MSLNKELNIIIKSSSASGIISIVGYLIMLLSSIVITRLVGASVFGTISVALSLVGTLSFLSNLGIDRGTIKYVSAFLGRKDYKSIKKIFLFSLSLSFAVSLIFLFILYFTLNKVVEVFFNNSASLKLALNFFVFLIPFYSSKNILVSLLSGLQKPHWVNFENLISFPTIKLLILLISIIWFTKLFSLIFANIIAFFVGYFMLLLMIKNLLKKTINVNNSLKNPTKFINYKEFIFFSIPLTLLPVFSIATQKIDLLLVGHFLTSSDAGVYAIIKRLGGIVIMPLSIFSIIVGTTVSKLKSINKYKEIREIYVTTTKWITILSSIVFIFIFVASPELLRLFGNDFVMGETALRIFIVGQLINSFVGPSGNTLLMIGKANLLVINNLISIIIGFSTAFFLIPKYGLIGSIIALTIIIVLANILSIIQLIVLCNISPFNVFMFSKRLAMIVISLFLIFIIKFIIIDFFYVYKLVIIGLASIVVVIVFALILEKIEANDRIILNFFFKK